MRDEVYRQIAREYLKSYSEELRRELNTLEREQAGAITLALDRRVHGEIATLKRARFLKVSSLAAACIAFAVIVPAFFRYSFQPPAAPSSSAAASAPVYELLPLSFSLPPQFSVAQMQQDMGQTIYYLENELLDPVVMTMEVAGDSSWFDQLTPVDIAGHDAYAKSENGYSLLSFVKQDVTYVLTCRYDINTLVDLSKSILV